MTSGLQEVDGSAPMVCEIGVPKDSVVNAMFFTREVREDGVKPPVVAIPGADEALRVAAVAVASPWSDERGEVAILFAEGNAVIAVPGVCYCLVGPARYGARLLGRHRGYPFLALALFEVAG